MSKGCDVAVLGGGPAGIAAAVRLRSLGLDVQLCSRPRANSMEGLSERSVAALEAARLERTRAVGRRPVSQIRVLERARRRKRT